MSTYGTAFPDALQLPPIEGCANDYTFLEEKIGTITPNIPISIILPVYNRIDMLRRTMAMLAHQTYPLNLMEIIIADDGSNDNPEQLIDEFKPYFEVNYVRQRDEGYRLSHIRNLGIRSARYDNVIILDCDMAPVPTLVETFAKWLVFDEKVILIGHRRYVDANDISPKDVLKDPSCMLKLPPVATQNAVMKQSPTKDWREPIYESTNLLKNSPNPFRASSCGNVAFHRRLFGEAGNFDESFTAWGAEDNEFGYRVWNAGYYFIPLLDALGLHQEPPGGREFVDREAGKLITRPMLLDKVPTYRKYDPEIQSTTPSVSIYIPAYNAVETISRSIDSALNQTYRDFEIVVCDDGSTDGTGELIDKKYGADPRITLLHQKNMGIGAASNACINTATGMYILQLDSDDEMHPLAIEKLLPLIKANPKMSCIYGRHCKRNDSSGEILDAWHYPEFSRTRMLHGMIIHHPRLFRKRDWSRANGFSESLENEVEYDFFQRLSEIGEIYHHDEILYTYTVHSKSTSIEKKDIQTLNTFGVMNNALERMNLRNWNVERDVAYSNPRAVKFTKKLTSEETLKKESDPFISVVIITRNRAKLLGDSIRSTLNQTYNKFELLVIDDGSTDNTSEVVKSFNDKRLCYFQNEPSGIPHSRNFGVNKSKGEYIVIMDDDDLMLPNRIREQVDALTPGSSGSYGGWIDQDAELKHEYFPGGPHGYSQILFGGKIMLHPASMIKRSVLMEYPYDENYSYGTDYVMNLEIARAGNRLDHTGTYILLRRFHGANVTLTNTGEQKGTARVRRDEFLDGLDKETERKMRQEWKETQFYTKTPKPEIELLETYFPWMKITMPVISTAQPLPSTSDLDKLEHVYDVNSRWEQDGQTLQFDALTRKVSFEMPFGWKLSQTHQDLLRGAHFVLMSPWEKGILDNWKPSRSKGWRASLAFSGGVDSTACMLLMASDTILCYHERSGFKSQLNHSNAHHFIEQLEKDGRPVVIIKSDHEQIRLDRGKGPGFSTDLAAAVHIILLADYLELGSIALGMPLENAYLFHGYKGRDFVKSSFWKTHQGLLSKMGLDLVYPTAGVSEIINQTLVENSNYAHFAESCLRSKKRGEVCGLCWKCFRKNSLKGKPIEIEGEILTFLGKRPLKQAISTLYAIQRLPPNQLASVNKQFPDLKELLEQDYSLIERHLPKAFELLPSEHRRIVQERLEAVSGAMSEDEMKHLFKINLSGN
jgi:chondroitin synthase